MSIADAPQTNHPARMGAVNRKLVKEANTPMPHRRGNPRRRRKNGKP